MCRSQDLFPLFPPGFGGKVTNSKPTDQTILENNFLKSVNDQNGGFFQVWKNTPVICICVYARVSPGNIARKIFSKKLLKCLVGKFLFLPLQRKPITT